MLTDHPKRSIGLHLYVGRWAEAIYKLSESPNRFKKKVNMKGVECPSFLLHLMMKKLRSCMKKAEHACMPNN